MGAATSPERVMRMRFELERDDNPPLFDELMKFPKGTKRLNRLRTLAHEGLHTQRGSSVPLGRAEAKFFRDGVRSQSDVQTSLEKPWCFCASLAWGPEAPETDLLRRFRDRILRRTAAGRGLIRVYYRTAPGLCRRVEGRRKLIRALCLGLKPALWIAKAALAIQDEKERA